MNTSNESQLIICVANISFYIKGLILYCNLDYYYNVCQTMNLLSLEVFYIIAENKLHRISDRWFMEMRINWTAINGNGAGGNLSQCKLV